MNNHEQGKRAAQVVAKLADVLLDLGELYETYGDGHLIDNATDGLRSAMGYLVTYQKRKWDLT